MPLIEDVIDILKYDFPFCAGGLSPTCEIFVGYGRNLTKRPLTKQEGELLLLGDVEFHVEDLLISIPGWKALPDTAKTVLICLTYTLGINGVLDLKEMLAALDQHGWQVAAGHLLATNWAEQNKDKAWRMSELLRDLAYVDQEI